MIKDETVFANILTEHDQYVLQHTDEWRSYRDAFANDFWNNTSGGRLAPDGTARSGRRELANYPLKMQVNRIQTWVNTYLDALFHKGIKSLVSEPTLPKEAPESTIQPLDAGTPDDPSDDLAASDAVAAVLDEWTRQTDIEDQTVRGVTLGLMYPESAFKVGMLDDDRLHPIRRVWLDVIPPWELVMDRRVRSWDAQRYIGHTYWISQERFLERFPDFSESDLDPQAIPDGLTDNNVYEKESDIVADKSYVRILELLDLTAEYEKEGVLFAGELRVYLVSGGKRDKGDQHVPIFTGPPPFTDNEGRPLINLIPQVLMPIPDFPFTGVPPVADIYEMNSEENYVNTFMVNAARRDASRQLLLDKNAWDDEDIAKLTNGKDMQLIPLDTDEPIANTAMWLDKQPVSGTMLQVLSMLQSNRESTSNVSPLARGEAMKYASAAEVHSLNQYTESTMGRIRKKMDTTIVRVLRLYLRVLDAVMEEGDQEQFIILKGRKVVVFQKVWLGEDWEINIQDAQSTPVKDAQRRQDIQLVAPMLTELGQAVAGGDPMATAILDYLVDIYELPSSMSSSEIKAKAPPPAPEMPPGAPGGAPGAPGGGQNIPEGAEKDILGATVESMGGQPPGMV